MELIIEIGAVTTEFTVILDQDWQKDQIVFMFFVNYQLINKILNYIEYFLSSMIFFYHD